MHELFTSPHCLPYAAMMGLLGQQVSWCTLQGSVRKVLFCRWVQDIQRFHAANLVLGVRGDGLSQTDSIRKAAATYPQPPQALKPAQPRPP